MVAVTQPADPVEVAGVGLVQPPATFVLESMIMSASSAEIAAGGGSAVAVLAGVVFVRSAGRGAAADHDAGPVTGFQIAT